MDEKGTIMEDPKGWPKGHVHHVPPTPSSTSRAVPSPTPMEEGARGRAIFGELALAVLDHGATTSGGGLATTNGNMITFVGVDLLAAVTQTK